MIYTDIDYNLALQYKKHGLCVLPAIKTEKRPNLSSWDVFKKRLPTEKELAQWFSASNSGVCIVCGEVSGNLEIIDFDEQGIAFGPWSDKVKKEPLVQGLFERLVVEQTQRGGFHVIYRCELTVAGNQKLAKNESGKTIIETRGEGGLFLCAPTEGYELKQNNFDSIPTITAVERNILFETAKSLNQVKHKQQNVSYSLGLPISQINDGYSQQRPIHDTCVRPGDAFNQSGDIRELLKNHGWTLYRSDGEEEHWTRPGKPSGTSGTLREVDGKLWFYVFSSNAEPLEAGKSYDAFGLFMVLEADGDSSTASRMLHDRGFGESFKPSTEVLSIVNGIDWDNFSNGGIKPENLLGQESESKYKKSVFCNRRDPANFDPFPVDVLPILTRDYVVGLAESQNQDPSGIAMALLTQVGAHIGASVKLRLGNDRFTAPILWTAYIGISGAGKSPAINAIGKLADEKMDEYYREYSTKQKAYLAEVKAYEKAKRKGESVQVPIAPKFRQAIVTDATYEGLIKSVRDSGGRTLLKVDELMALFAMTNRTKTPGEAQKWLSGYNGESVSTARTTSQEIYIRDAYWAISGGTTPEKFRDMICSDGRSKDGTLSRFCLVWPAESSKYKRKDISLSVKNNMKSIVEYLLDFAPDEGTRYKILNLDYDTQENWEQWKEDIFYSKRNAGTDTVVSFISKSEDLLPRIAIILHCLEAAERTLERDSNEPIIQTYSENDINYSEPVRRKLSIPDEIEIETWMSAMEITEWIRNETMACYRQLQFVDAETPDENTNKAMSIIRSAGPAGITIRGIGQKSRVLRDRNILSPILDNLKNKKLIKEKTERTNNNKDVSYYIYIKPENRMSERGSDVAH